MSSTPGWGRSSPPTRQTRLVPSFEDLIAEGESVPVDGWDFSWFEGRATEERPPWGYARLMGERMARAQAALDIETGGGGARGTGGAAPRGCGGRRRSWWRPRDGARTSPWPVRACATSERGSSRRRTRPPCPS